MKQLLEWILIGGVTLILIQCSERQAGRAIYVKPEFNRRALIQAEQSDSLPDTIYISRFDLDEEENLYLFDINSYSVKKYDFRGRKLGEAGQMGPGPEEFVENNYHFLKWTGSNIAVYNLEAHKIQLIDSELNFMNTHLFETPFFDFDYNSKGEGVYSFIEHRSRDALRIYEDLHFNQIDKEYGLQLNQSNLYFNIFSLKFLDDQHFVGGYAYRNLIQIFSLDGRITNSFKVPGWPRLSEVKVPYVPEKIMIQDITTTEEGDIWVLGGGYAPNRRRDIYVFGRSGDYKHTFTLPIESPQIEYRSGKLYTVDANRSNILEWEIIF